MLMTVSKTKFAIEFLARVPPYYQNTYSKSVGDNDDEKENSFTTITKTELDGNIFDEKIVKTVVNFARMALQFLLYTYFLSECCFSITRTLNIILLSLILFPLFVSQSYLFERFFFIFINTNTWRDHIISHNIYIHIGSSQQHTRSHSS